MRRGKMRIGKKMCHEINLFRLEKPDPDADYTITTKSHTYFTIIFKSFTIINIKIHIPSCGSGIIHELIELDLIAAVLKMEHDILDYEWVFCRNLFHYLTETMGHSGETEEN